MADHDDLAPAVVHLGHFDVHLGHQRTGGVEYLQLARLRLAPDRLRHAVRAEHHRGALRYFRQILDEHGALGAQIVHYIFVVHDFVTDVDRRAVKLQRALDDLDGAVYAGAEAARDWRAGLA